MSVRQVGSKSRAARDKLTEPQRQRLDALPYGQAFTTDQALDALEAEVARRRQAKPRWRIPWDLVMTAPWGDPRWRAGSWISVRHGVGQQAVEARAKMTEQQLDRFRALPYGPEFSVDQALDALEAEVAQQRQAKPGWRIPQGHAMPAPWGHPKWKAGSWVSNRSGPNDEAQKRRGKLTEQQRQRLDALPYGEISTDEALDSLEAEVARLRQGEPPQWRMPTKHVMPATWGDPSWAGGSWVLSRRGATAWARKTRDEMTERQLERLNALPFGDITPDEALAALEADVARQRQAEPGWRIRADHTMPAPWGHPTWKGGTWLSNLRGASDDGQRRRGKLTERQRQRVDALPYGDITPDEALDALEAEVERQRQAEPGWRIPYSHVMAAPWGDPEWAAGSWTSVRRSTSTSAQAQKRRAKLTERQRQRVDALPYGGGV